jgi:methionyl-tRNA synthetase
MQGEISWDRIGDLQMVPIGSVIKDSFHLFSKMEDDVIQKQIDYLYAKTHKVEVMENQTVEKPEEKLISFDDFSKMDIRIGTILTAERVEGTDKLMKLSVDIGFEVRTIVSGIAHAFSVEDVVNKRIQVLANLAPRKIKGIESKGMILFADNGESLAFVSPLGDVPNGAGVK